MGMALDEPVENEQPLHINGLEVLIDDAIKPVTDGNILDYVKSPDGEGFVIAPESGSACSGDCC